MKHNDLALEKAAANNFHPDQVWARKLQRQLARQGMISSYMEEWGVPSEFAKTAVEFSTSKSILRMTHLFACVRLARKNDNADPEFPKNPEVEITSSGT